MEVGYNYSVSSKLQQYICHCSLVAWICPFPSRVGGLRELCVLCGGKEVEPLEYVGSGCGTADWSNCLQISAVVHRKIAEFCHVRLFVV